MATIAHCRISQPPAGAPSLVASSGHFGGVASPGAGIYHVSLAAGYALTPLVGLQVSGTDRNVTASAGVKTAPDGTHYIAVYRQCGGQPEDGDVWLWAAGIEEIS